MVFIRYVDLLNLAFFHAVKRFDGTFQLHQGLARCMLFHLCEAVNLFDKNTIQNSMFVFVSISKDSSKFLVAEELKSELI